MLPDLSWVCQRYNGLRPHWILNQFHVKFGYWYANGMSVENPWECVKDAAEQ